MQGTLERRTPGEGAASPAFQPMAPEDERHVLDRFMARMFGEQTDHQRPDLPRRACACDLAR